MQAERGGPETQRLLRELGHEVGNALAAVRLTAHLAQADPAPDAPAAFRIIDLACARAAALMAQMRPLLTPGSEAERSRLSAAEILAGLASALSDAAVSVAEPAAGLPDLRADADALHHLALMLALGVLERAKDTGPLRIQLVADGPELVLSLVSDTAGAVNELELEIAAAVLARDGARVAVPVGAGATRLELRFPSCG